MTLRPHAELSTCIQAGDFIRFSIGRAHDIYATTIALETEIPAWARRYDKKKLEWRVHRDYFFVLDQLFDNFPHILFDSGAGYQPRPIPKWRLPSGSIPLVGGVDLRAFGLAFLLIGFLVAAIWGGAQALTTSSVRINTFSATPVDQTTTQANDGNQAPGGGNNASAGEIITDTVELLPTVVPVEAVNAAAVLTERESNLRTGPGVEYEVVEQIAANETLIATGRLRNDGGEIWYRLADSSWIFAEQTTGVYDGLRWIEPEVEE